MSRRSPLIIDWRSPPPGLPVEVLPRREREGRTLAIVTRDLVLCHPSLKVPVKLPAGYVTDWASIPSLVQWRIQPMGRHAAAALFHDWLYAIGEPGRRAEADAIFASRMELDGVNAVRRGVMHAAVRLGGARGYASAPQWWDTANFRDLNTYEPCAPPYPREAAFGWGHV